MFSANENLMLRQHKRRIVDRVEATMPEEALDFGTTTMVMQVTCKAPGCVPLETAIIIVFPKSQEELIPGLPESKNGGSYKTKILKPMADVTDDDVLEALPPAFEGGKRTMEKLSRYARDVMLAQITQVFGEEDDKSVSDRAAMAEYLQVCLQDYIARRCKPPKLGEAFPPLENGESIDPMESSNEANSEVAKKAQTTSNSRASSFPSKDDFANNQVLIEDNQTEVSREVTAVSAGTPIMNGPPKHQRALQQALNPSRSNNISKLFQREHAPGIRQAGCPCCDPDIPSALLDNMMML